jgi:ubiquinone/menaquinone biosynthesis C-methylase UbiE
LFDIAVARHNPNAEIWAVDWPQVLEVARENAAAAGVSRRYHTIPGSALNVEYGTDFDLALITNFLHHLDPATGEKLLAKVCAALQPGGRVVILEFVPNEDRVSPPTPARFSLTMKYQEPRARLIFALQWAQTPVQVISRY